MSCAVDTKKCPYGSAAELRTQTVDNKITVSESWNNYDIRFTTYCKLSVQHAGSYTSDRFKYNNMHIKIDTLS